MSNSELAFLGAVEAGERLARRELSAVELTRATLQRIERLDPRLRSYATVMADSALADARRADAELQQGKRRGPLHGVPVAVKDLCDTKGVVTASGIPMFRSNVPQRDSTVVQRLRDAGAVLLGKLQLTEGALALHHPDVPPPVNPWAAEHWSGASSSGSGVATAAGLAFGTLGSDTGGSIRFPSLCDGVVGLKPTWGRVSRYGVFPLSETLDHIGPITRSVDDAAAVLGAIAGRDDDDPTSLAASVPNYLDGIDGGVKGVRLGFDEAYCSQDVVPEVRKMIDGAVAAFQRLGADIRAIRMPPVRDAVAAWTPICAVEAAIAHARTYPSQASGYSSATTGFLDAGAALSGIDYARATIRRRNFAGALAALLESADLIVTPVMGTLIPTVEHFGKFGSKPDDVEKLVYFTCLYDLSGNPTLSLPAGLAGNGTPLGFQLVGRHLEETLLCRAGKAYQGVADWRTRRPPLAA